MFLDEVVAPLGPFLPLGFLLLLGGHDLSLLLPGVRISAFSLEGSFSFPLL